MGALGQRATDGGSLEAACDEGEDGQDEVVVSCGT